MTTTTAGMAPAAAAMTTAAMLGESRSRNGHCRRQNARHQDEAPTLDAHDCLHNLSQGTIALGAL
jgi:hypothetical protein